jgi:hypothetical protein
LRPSSTVARLSLEAFKVGKANLLPFLNIPADVRPSRSRSGNDERIKKVKRAARVVHVFPQVAADLLEDAATHGISRRSRAFRAMDRDDTLTAHQVAGAALLRAMNRRCHLPTLEEVDAENQERTSPDRIDMAPNVNSRSALSLRHLSQRERTQRHNEEAVGYAKLREAARIVKDLGNEARETLESTVRNGRQRSLSMEPNGLAKAALSRIRDYLLLQLPENEFDATQTIDRRALMSGISKLGLLEETRYDIVVSLIMLSLSLLRC